MRKETLGAALFFCGLGILFTLCDPFDGWFFRLAVSIALMLIGVRIGGCCRH